MYIFGVTIYVGVSIFSYLYGIWYIFYILFFSLTKNIIYKKNKSYLYTFRIYVETNAKEKDCMSFVNKNRTYPI